MDKMEQEIEKLKAYLKKKRAEKTAERRRNRENRLELSGYYRSPLPKKVLREREEKWRQYRIEYNRRYRQTHAEEIKAYKKAYRAANRLDIRAYQKEYQRWRRAKRRVARFQKKRNRKNRLEYMRAYRAAHRAELNALARKYYAAKKGKK